jgi:small-conductance mechanosensitive channel/CRP-like cAMP-binding protein
MPQLSHAALALLVFLTFEVLAFLLRRTQISRLLLHATALGMAAFVGISGSTLAVERPGLWQGIEVAALVLAVLFLNALIDVLLLRRPWNPQLGPLPALVRGLFLVLILIATTFFAASQILGLSLPAVLVSSTVLSAVLGLALQDVLKNVFAGMALQLEGSLKVGDWLQLDGQFARIAEMSWRSTTLLTNEGHRLIEPNAKISERKLTNVGTGRRPMAFPFTVSLPFTMPPARAKEALLAAARSAPMAAADPAPQAMVQRFAEYAIVYELRVWTRHVEAISIFRDQVQSRIWYEIHRAGLAIPFPVRDVVISDSVQKRALEGERELDRLAVLFGRLDLFRMLDRDALRRFAAEASSCFYDHEEVLVREGDPGDSLFVIDHGKVRVSKIDSDGERVVLASLGAGAFFGEMSLLTGEPRSATVQADGGCEVLVLTREDLQPVLAADPTIAEKLSRALAERAAATVAALEEHRHEDPRSKVEDESSFLSKIRDLFRLSL